MNVKTKLTVSEIQRFCMHDGPGVRTTVFLKGCPLHCKWCHNPEAQKNKPELLFYGNKCIGCLSCVSACPKEVHGGGNEHIILRNKCISCASCTNSCPSGALEMCGREMSCSDIISLVERDRAFYGEHGGITLSGGEPFAQNEATVELLKACKANGLSTVVETCGYCNTDVLISAIPYVDLFLWDIKDTNQARHKEYTGVSNELILRNLKVANDMDSRIRLRCILVNGVNTHEAHYENIAEIAKSIKHLDGVDIIPYHAYGGSKAVLLGLEDNGKKEWIPDEAQIEQAKKLLRERGVFA
jgi:pyruvate formate lyase activating enzyme